MNKTILKIVVFVYLIVLLLTIQISSILLSYGLMNSLLYSFVLVGFGIFGLLLYLLSKIYNKRLKIYDFAVILFIFYAYVSYVFAYDQRIALLGFLNRREGLLVLSSYYIFLLVSTTLRDKKYIKWLVYLLSFNVIMQICYGFLQIFEVNFFLGIEVRYKWKYAFGFVGNSNFLSSLVVLLLGIWFGVYLFNDQKSLFNIIILEVFLLGHVICGSMSGFVGLLVMILLSIVYIVYCYFQKNNWKILLKKLCLIVLLFICNIFILSLTGKNQYYKDVLELNSQFSEVVSGEIEDNFGTGRIYIWRKAFENMNDYIITGIGIDQFYYIGGEQTIYDSYTGAPVDKAHNEYLQILVTEGVFKCLTYIIFLMWIFVKSLIKIFKSNNNNYLFYGLFFAFTGYCVQAFFNISITRVAPIFFIISGLLIGYLEDDMLELNE